MTPSTAAQASNNEFQRQAADIHEALDAIRGQLRDQLKGKDEIVELALAAFLAGGHLLLEGSPGTGKTLLARSLALSFGGSFRRIQMTSDMLPSDIVGILRLKPGTSEFEFRKGPIFSNFLLADELNRTSPKTQSALLEAMAEGTVTIDGTGHSLPNPFFVVATQNPLEFQGVYPLAESQLDRFILQLTLDTPEKDSELRIYESFVGLGTQYPEVKTILTPEDVKRVQTHIARVKIDKSVLEYCLDLVRATRILPQLAYGVSVRGGLQLVAAARALAFLEGRDFVIPADIKRLAIPALGHRLCFADGSPQGLGTALHRKELIEGLLERIQAPR